MRVDVKIDTSGLKLRIPRERRRLAFNTAQALNETAKAIQTAERVNLDRKFTIRRAGFMYRLIKIVRFANARQNRPFVEVEIDPTKAGVILSKLEKGGVKETSFGQKVAVPITGTAARPSFRQLIPPAFRRSRLTFRPKRTKAGGELLKGPRRTFLVKGVGIIQRIGEATQLIYLFKRRPKLKPSLEFIDTALQTFRKEWPKQLARAYRRPQR